MSGEARPGIWHRRWEPGSTPEIVDEHDTPIAAIATASKPKMLARSSLIAAAPELYDAVHAVLRVFLVMAEHGDENTALAAQDMIPMLESVIDGANFLGEVTPETLSGP